MRRKKEKVICVVLASMLFLVGCSEKTNPEGGSEDGYQVIELTMAVNGTDNQIDARVGDYFAQLVEERSGGNVTVLAAFCVLAAVTLAGAYQAQQALPPYVGKDLTEEEAAEVIARNSPLTSYVRLSPNADFPREEKITKITIHHMGADLTLDALGASFGRRDREASANYGIDSSGNIGLYVEEVNRSWASSSPENDHAAVTIEVANEETGGNWRVSDRAYEALIALCTDICRRNGMEELVYTGDTSGSLTIHKMFADTACPGPYLESRMEEIAETVSKNLKGS